MNALEYNLKLINEWSFKWKIIKEVAKENDISGGMLRGWIIKYYKFGESSLENQKKLGNPLCKYPNKINLNI